MGGGKGGREGVAHPHQWKDAVDGAAAAVDAEGKGVRMCTVCGLKQEGELL